MIGTMSDTSKSPESPESRIPEFLSYGVAVVILIVMANSNYLLFHSLTELFSIVIAFGIFIIGWNSRKNYHNNYLLFIGIAYLFVAFFDTLHTLAYKGMGVFKGCDDNNLPPQLWLIARYLESISLLLAPFFFNIRFNHRRIILAFSIASLGALYAIFYARIFPACFITGTGLTPFKRVSEYVIDVILLVALVLLHKRKEQFDPKVLRLLTLSILCAMVTELCFTLYVHLYGISNLIGHIFKIFSFLFMYKAIIETALTKPYDLLFKELSDRSDKLSETLDINQKIIAESAAGILAYRIDTGACIIANEAAARSVGASAQKLKQQCFRSIPSWRQSGLLEEAEKVITTEVSSKKRFQLVTSFGRTLILDCFISLFKSSGDTHLMLIFEDITEKKLAEDVVIKSSDRLNEAQRIAHIGNWELDLQSGALYWSDEIYRIFEIDKAKFGASYEAFLNAIHPDDRERVNKAYTESLEKRTPYAIKHRLLMPDGRIKHVHEQSETSFDDAGKPLRSFGTVQDITELEHVRLAAEAASKAKGQFLANMSHEIRTPLNAVFGMLHLLQRTELLPRQLDYLHNIQVASRTLLSVLNDILDFSKIEAGKLELELSPFRLGDLLHNHMVILSGAAQEKNLELRYSIDTDIPFALVGDAMRLQQVLLNLTGNAIKFTATGEVHIAVRALSLTPERAELEFAVRDSGIGIAPEMLEHIFDGFTQAEASTTRRFGGTGLGLAISSQLVELMGGQLTVESETGKGSTFRFTVGFDCAPVDTVTNQSAPACLLPRNRLLNGLRLLVVEDNLINQQVAREILTQEGACVVVAAGGRQALELLASEELFDAVLMDIQMPEMDGYEATRLIRGTLGMTELPIIAMTAHALAGERKKSLAAGMIDHVTKPVDPDALIASLIRCTRPKNGIRVDAASEQLSGQVYKGADMSDKKAKILIVDDTPANIQILNETLQDEFKTYFALNGNEALLKAQSLRPDLILLDVMMPGVDGFEVCRRLKEIEALKNIPIIFITALGQPEEESRGLRLGAADYITKPFNPDLVLLRVRIHLELKSRRDALEQRSMELEKALDEIKMLQGVIPICAACKKIRNDEGYWQQVEVYISEHSAAEFSHSICPSCAKELYPAQYAKMFPGDVKSGV